MWIKCTTQTDRASSLTWPIKTSGGQSLCLFKTRKDLAGMGPPWTLRGARNWEGWSISEKMVELNLFLYLFSSLLNYQNVNLCYVCNGLRQIRAAYQHMLRALLKPWSQSDKSWGSQHIPLWPSNGVEYNYHNKSLKRPLTAKWAGRMLKMAPLHNTNIRSQT